MREQQNMRYNYGKSKTLRKRSPCDSVQRETPDTELLSHVVLLWNLGPEPCISRASTPIFFESVRRIIYAIADLINGENENLFC